MRELPVNPRDIGILHFCGIGGMGMSGLAVAYQRLGFKVRGSDIAVGANVERLRALGIPVTLRQDGHGIEEAAYLVRSSAIKEDNPEIRVAKHARVPIIKRGEMLAEYLRQRKSIAIAGTHGKTTTTSLIGHVLDTGSLDPTIINGGIIVKYQTNVRVGNGDWVVCEADESDSSFLSLSPVWSVITNIDPDHMDHYQSLEALTDAYEKFVHQVPFYGLIFACIDHPRIRQLIHSCPNRRFKSFGFSEDADYRALRAQQVGRVTHMEVRVPCGQHFTFELNLIGRHNVQNALAAVACGMEMGVGAEKIGQALKTFSGVKRRFSTLWRDELSLVIEDYAHHPEEIIAVLNSARDLRMGEIIAIFQPHRFSRTQHLFTGFSRAFSLADATYFLPTYPAGESPIPNAGAKEMARSVAARGDRAAFIPSSQALFELLEKSESKKRIVLFMGAGDITYVARAYAERMRLRAHPEAP